MLWYFSLVQSPRGRFWPFFLVRYLAMQNKFNTKWVKSHGSLGTPLFPSLQITAGLIIQFRFLIKKLPKLSKRGFHGFDQSVEIS